MLLNWLNGSRMLTLAIGLTLAVGVFTPRTAEAFFLRRTFSFLFPRVSSTCFTCRSRVVERSRCSSFGCGTSLCGSSGCGSAFNTFGSFFAPTTYQYFSNPYGFDYWNAVSTPSYSSFPTSTQGCQDCQFSFIRKSGSFWYTRDDQDLLYPDENGFIAGADRNELEEFYEVIWDQYENLGPNEYLPTRWDRFLVNYCDDLGKACPGETSSFSRSRQVIRQTPRRSVERSTQIQEIHSTGSS